MSIVQHSGQEGANSPLSQPNGGGLLPGIAPNSSLPNSPAAASHVAGAFSRMEHITAMVAAFHRIPAQDIISPRRTIDIAHARQEAMALIREIYPEISESAIGRFFRRDHSTTRAGIRAVATRASRDWFYAEGWMVLRGLVKDAAARPVLGC